MIKVIDALKWMEEKLATKNKDTKNIQRYIEM